MEVFIWLDADMFLAALDSGKWKMVSQAVSQGCGHINEKGSYFIYMQW